MKEKVKFDQYAVYEKGRLYEVIVFPFIQYMFAYGPDECGIDAGYDSYAYIGYAMAILADDPGKLIYFPCKQLGGDWYPHTYHAVFCRPELQFRRSLWTRIKGRLDRKHWQGKYLLQYDRKKLCDYLENVIDRKYGDRNAVWSYHIRCGKYGQWKRSDGWIEKTAGDTVFFVLERLCCYWWHYSIAETLEEWKKKEPVYGEYVSTGYIFSDVTLQEIKESLHREHKEKSIL